jgi:hypothetical protein
MISDTCRSDGDYHRMLIFGERHLRTILSGGQPRP